MTSKRVLLYAIEEPVLLVAHPSGPIYQNQCGGVTCSQGELESFLCPLGIGAAEAERIEAAPYPAGRIGISNEIADVIDDVLAGSPSTAFLTVDRTLLNESMEA